MASREEAVSPSGERRCRAAYGGNPSVRCELTVTDRTTHPDHHRGFDSATNTPYRWNDQAAVRWQGCESTYTHKASGRVVECDESAGHGDDHRGWYRGPTAGSIPWMVTWSDAQADPVARDTQVAGDHYSRFAIQPWDIWQEYGLDAFTGTVVKYLLRAGRKGSKLEDLRKARHTLDRLIEIEERKQ